MSRSHFSRRWRWRLPACQSLQRLLLLKVIFLLLPSVASDTSSPSVGDDGSVEVVSDAARTHVSEDRSTMHKVRRRGAASDEDEHPKGASKETSTGDAREEVSATDYACSVMLLGAVVFVMVLFLASNQEDEDMRFYVWRVISATVGIFVSVLMFTTLFELLERRLLTQGTTLRQMCIANLLQLLFYFTLLQVIIAITSGALRPDPFPPCYDKKGGLIPLKARREERELSLVCFATILSHMTGFAAITLGAYMQKDPACLHNPSLMFAVIPVMNVGLWIMSATARVLRIRVIAAHGHKPGTARPRGSIVRMQGENEVGEFMRGGSIKVDPHEIALHMWESEAYEAEVDVSALCTSFCIVQALRYTLTGNMPDPLGIEEDHYLHSPSHISQLLAASGLGACLTAVLVVLTEHAYPKRHAHDMKQAMQGKFSIAIFFKLIVKRYAFVFTEASAMICAWCFLFGLQWAILHYYPNWGSPHCIVFKLNSALVVSAFAFLITSLLDKIADAQCVASDDLDEMLDMGVIKIIHALSIAVGFSWEQAFDGGVKTIAEASAHRGKSSLFLTFGICGIVGYAWRAHILLRVLRLQEFRTLKKDGAGHPVQCYMPCGPCTSHYFDEEEAEVILSEKQRHYSYSSGTARPEGDSDGSMGEPDGGVSDESGVFDVSI
eukprot:TRINITY_DN113137_c0_g1_i1.p1 TRINITY_DN113137_c0_g1~~TRINITY_DN113137_c0_g1_i1.p1  ORF type:complete len:665 (+),score=148.45 TRINITY_DN113137_c0_g1_i1:105-2099(+)